MEPVSPGTVDAGALSGPEVVGDAPDGLLVVDDEGTVRYANPVAQDLYGQQDLVGRAFGLPLTTDRTEVELLTDDGGPRVVEMRARRATWAGERVHLVWLHDVTGLVSRQRELTARLAGLEARLANVAHDVRSPIAAARSLIELSATVDAGEAERNREAALRNLRHALEVLDELVQPDDAQATEPTSRVELWSVLASATDGVVHEDVDIEVRGPIDALALQGRRRQIEQILRNLLTNAVKYGAEPIVIDVSGDNGEVVVRVIDHGDGVPEELRPRLFTRYAPGDDRGTGLGLSIVRGLAESNDGTIAYVDDGPGACFELRLPSG